jgi:hypothetical protein
VGDYEEVFDPILGRNRAKDIFTGSGIISLNGLTNVTQTFATGTSGADFNISSSGSTHTFNLPTASATNRGALSSNDWTNFNTAYGWGDHALEGYLKNIVEDTTPQLGGDLDTNSNDIKFLDNDKAIFGTGSDAEIFYDGNDFYIQSLAQDRDIFVTKNIGGVQSNLIRTIGEFVQLDEGRLVLENDGSFTTFIFRSYGNNNRFVAFRANGTLASPTALLSGNDIFRISNRGHDGTSFTQSKAEIFTQASENWTPTANGTRICFETTANGTTTKLERLCIENDGSADFKENNLNNVGDITHDNASASDWIFRNSDLDKDIIFNLDDSGVDTEKLRIFGTGTYSTRISNGILQVKGNALHFDNEGQGVASRGTVWSSGSAGHAAGFLFIRGRGTEASPAAIQSGDTIGYTRYVGYYDSSSTFRGAEIFSNAGENWDASNRGTFICIDATPNGSINRIPHAIFEEGRITLPHTSGVADSAVIKFEEKDTTPSNPTINVEAKCYEKDDKFVWQFNNGGTVRYFYIDLTATAAQQVQHTTTPI